MKNEIKAVAVYCASSTQVSKVYVEAAEQLGKLLAEHGVTLIYGGGAVGLMGAICDAVKANGGKAIGVIPSFMVKKGWLRPGLDEVIEVDTMAERKRIMAEISDAAIALPGGVGTFDELMDIVALKKLGLYLKPVVILNTQNYYQPLADLLERSVIEHFQDEKFRQVWCMVDSPAAAVETIFSEPYWSEDVIENAAL
ncbi:MAG: TIGR00730 family Rossman fold protein [Bacteroidaceae bacterium]|nr:TIGR00730 family Rossman fold protein [Bacteroidaceae bacterium]